MLKNNNIKIDPLKISLIVILILVLLFTGLNRPKKRKEIKQAKAAVAEAKDKIPAKDMFSIQEQEGKNLKLKRDPFAVASISSTDSSSDLHLDGIFWDGAKSLAVINNTIVKVGDKIGGNTVVDIQEEKVILNDGQHNVELK